MAGWQSLHPLLVLCWLLKDQSASRWLMLKETSGEIQPYFNMFEPQSELDSDQPGLELLSGSDTGMISALSIFSWELAQNLFWCSDSYSASVFSGGMWTLTHKSQDPLGWTLLETSVEGIFDASCYSHRSYWKHLWKISATVSSKNIIRQDAVC